MTGQALEAVRAALRDQLGDAADLVRDDQLDRWFNRGRQRLGLFDLKSAALSWADGATSVALPTDCVDVERLLPVSPLRLLPTHILRRASVEFLDPSSVTAGSATLFYRAEFPDVTSVQPSTMPRLADEAAISFAIARFYERIAGTRADFRRYTAVTGQSGVDVQDLLDLANRHDADFADARQQLTLGSAASFYGD